MLTRRYLLNWSTIKVLVYWLWPPFSTSLDRKGAVQTAHHQISRNMQNTGELHGFHGHDMDSALTAWLNMMALETSADWAEGFTLWVTTHANLQKQQQGKVKKTASISWMMEELCPFLNFVWLWYEQIFSDIKVMCFIPPSFDWLFTRG